MTGFVSEFTTFYGTSVLGMFCTWGNTAVDKAGTIDAGTTLSIDMDIRLYAANLDSSSGNVIDATGGASHEMSFYLQFMNPYETTTGNSQAFSVFLYDAVIGDIAIATTAGPPHTAVFTWDTDGIADAKCLAAGDHLNVANCVNDALNAYSTTTTGDQCVEKWTLANQELRCVRVRNSFSRPFLTTDTNAVDFDLGYRPFKILAGWVIQQQATVPLKMDFAG